MSNKTTSFMSSHSAFILALSGAAIGIGSIWRMPYTIGEYGGSLFIICYLFFLFLLGLPAMIAEISIGKIGRENPTLSLKKIALLTHSSEKWSYIAVSGIICSVLILSFYSIVSGWGLYYLNLALHNTDFSNTAAAGTLLNTFLAQPWSLLIYNMIFLFLTFFVSAFEIQKGIERLNNILMPLLYCIVIGLVIYTMSLKGFDKAVSFLLSPDWSKLSWQMLLTAMGMAFFTLATGACCLMAYGAYMPQHQSISFSAGFVVLLNLITTLCMGFIIFSIVFSYDLDATSGPGLVFIALPVAFSHTSINAFLSPCFFFLLFIACWTSSINLAEPFVATLAKKLNSRVKGAIIAGIVVFCLSLIPLLSFNVLKDIRLFGQDLFSFYTGFAADILLPFTGVMILLFARKMLKSSTVNTEEIFPSRWSKIWQYFIIYLSPWLLLCILISNIMNLI